MHLCKLLFLTFFKIYTCFDMNVFKYDIDFEDTIEDYPFTVLVIEDQPRKINNFGTLIHDRAVLTYQAEDTDNQKYFSFKAYAGCSFGRNNGDRNDFYCSQNRTIAEYNIIHQYPKDYSYLHMVILILSKPFEINKKVHVIKLAYDPIDYDPNSCRILYYMMLKNSNSSKSVRFAYSTEIYYSDGFADVLLDTSELEKKYGYQETELFGNPVVCRSNTKGVDWVQVFFSYVVLNPKPSSPFDYFAHVISPYYEKFEEILYHSGFFNNLTIG